jgi:murein DD-endopeptidase MepM/ murein hydrolase activator NlpD
VAVLALLLAVPTLATAGPTSSRTRKAALRSRLSRVSSRIRATRTELSQAKRSEAAIAAELDSVRAHLNDTRRRLAAARSRLAHTRAVQEQAARALIRSQQRLQEGENRLGERLAANWRQGPVRYASVVLGARTMAEMVTRAQLVRAIVRYDATLIAQIQADREAVLAWKHQVDLRAQQAVAVQREFEAQQAEEARALVQQKAVLAEARARRAEIEDDLAALEEDSQSIATRLRALEATAAGQARFRVRFTGRFAEPVSGPIVSGFGMRFHPILHRARLHAGVDFGVGYGTPIGAAAAGVVVYSGTMRGYGNVIVIDHGGGLSTLYAHCSALLVGDGVSVAQGQIIARVGATGLATGPHLHFEVRRGGSPVDPRGAL